MRRLAHGFRISLWTLAGLVGGTAWGILQFRGPQVIANAGFIGAFSGLTVGFVSNIRAHWLVQGALAGIISGTTAALLAHWLRVSSQPLLETLTGMVAGFTVGFVVFRSAWHIWERRLKTGPDAFASFRR